MPTVVKVRVVVGRGCEDALGAPAAHLIVCSRHRLTVAWLVWAQREARESMELLKTLNIDVYHELLDALLE